jgi:hypothetical protein
MIKETRIYMSVDIDDGWTSGIDYKKCIIYETLFRESKSMTAVGICFPADRVRRHVEGAERMSRNLSSMSSSEGKASQGRKEFKERQSSSKSK